MKKKEKEILFEKYKLLVTARNFHYDNFNKWLTYFYVANAAIFVGYVQVLVSDELLQKELVEVPILLLGFVAGLLLFWSSKGYYYWNINFIMLVNHYEKTLLKWKKDERIYSMFANKIEQNNYLSIVKGANFSTSKIAILFSYLIAFSWANLLAYYLISFCICSIPLRIFLALIISAVLILILSIPFLKDKNNNPRHFLWSNTDPLDDLRIKQDKDS